jgi:putative ABC transport system ATP-binding protein
VFQSPGLIALLTALENVALGLEIAAIKEGDAKQAAVKALEAVGLADRSHHRSYELSGGEQLRVAIARAIVKHPIVLIADEPTAHLDSETGAEVFSLLRSVSTAGTAVLMATHDENLAHRADRVMTLIDGVLGETEALARN